MILIIDFLLIVIVMRTFFLRKKKKSSLTIYIQYSFTKVFCKHFCRRDMLLSGFAFRFCLFLCVACGFTERTYAFDITLHEFFQYIQFLLIKKNRMHQTCGPPHLVTLLEPPLLSTINETGSTVIFEFFESPVVLSSVGYRWASKLCIVCNFGREIVPESDSTDRTELRCCLLPRF